MHHEREPKKYHVMYKKDRKWQKLYENSFGYWQAIMVSEYYQEYRGIITKIEEVKNAK